MASASVASAARALICDSDGDALLFGSVLEGDYQARFVVETQTGLESSDMRIRKDSG